MDDSTTKRDLRLALDQKDQADRLVETLTRRCDSLRSKLIADREHSAKVIAELDKAIENEKAGRLQAEKKFREAELRCASLEREVEILRKRNHQLKKVAETAVSEALETLKVVAKDT